MKCCQTADTLCGSDSEEEANEKGMFQYASIFEKGRRILPRSIEPKGENGSSTFRPELRLKRANLKDEFCQLMLRRKGR
jgi:hypothetical protein